MSTLKIEAPPAVRPRKTPRPSQLQENLIALAALPEVWGRISDYSSKKVAQQTVYYLQSGVRRHPKGKWEFTWGPIEDTDLYGVWAKFLGPE